ncbi:hypothetical protein K2173_007285 [Erythroxylum novogranatense]|uniref:TFIIS N-terminal domain-containing protein n=1 Tax=Erythroxylum novogranatense TaxID=1862640 RepID=A0AAV8T7D7_9ROSI|nr:hypothetical protein K2173_007285 [Erythroxylum novogranatense]
MTLEDFFTLSEMKDGLTAPSRVQELVAVMQKEKDCAVKNIGDATRQWAAVASTIAATDNRDCLDLFIQLDGLCFIDRWLNDAQNFANDTTDSFAEESITALLRALEKLQVEKERSISSGIFITVNNLLDHTSSRVQDRARALFDGWKEGKLSKSTYSDTHGPTDVDPGAVNNEKSGTECALAFPPSKGSDNKENNMTEPAKVQISLSRSSSSTQVEKVEDGQVHSHSNNHLSPMVLDHKSEEGGSPNHPTTSTMSPSVLENLVKEKSVLNSSEVSSIEVPSFTVPKGEIEEQESDSSKKPDIVQDVRASTAVKVESHAFTGSDASSVKETGSFLQNNTDDMGIGYHSNDPMLKSITNKSNCSTDAQEDFPGKDSTLEKPDESSSPASEMEDIVPADDDAEHSDADDVVGDTSDFSKLTMEIRSPDPIGRRRSDIELDYGIVDALEVARQVAQEVEREVVDYKEPSCSSSSEKIMNNSIPGSPNSVSGNQELATAVLPDDVPARSCSPVEHTEEEGKLGNPDNQVAREENREKESQSFQVTEVAQAAEIDGEKGSCNFDLNQEVHSDDAEHPVNPILTPISVVSASRPMTVSGSPAAPLEFSGSLGWKGSAATSAFRPASPRKVSDGDKTVETGGLKQRHFCLDIDLNVAEDGDEKVINITSERQIPFSSGLNSGGSSLELGPRRLERPNLDLNRISDDGDALSSDLRLEGQVYYPRNSHGSPSPASSSSSMRPSMRNFDLNDRPLFQNDASEQGLFHGKSSQNPSAHRGQRPTDNVVSIFGTRVEVGSRMDVRRKDLTPQTISLPNGRYADIAMDANVARIGGPLVMVPSVSYTNSPLFGYNGLASVPTMSISSAMYGPGTSIPYMVDSRGAPVVPQIMGSASIVPPYSQSSFIVSMTNAPHSQSVAGSSRSNFDLNSGFAIDGGNTGSLRQFFMPSQARPLEANFQPSSSSGISEKRKEPDGGWEPFSSQHKHPQAPWR